MALGRPQWRAVAARRLILRAAVAVFALAAPVGASAATSYVVVRDTTGRTVAEAVDAGFDYPEDGSLVHVGHAAALPGGIELDDVVVLGGRIRADRLLVPARGVDGARVDGLTVNGSSVQAGSNTIVSFGGPSYAVILQEARSETASAVIGLRLHLAESGLGQAGWDVLIAPGGAVVPGASDGVAGGGSLSVLGFANGSVAPAGGKALSYPLGVHGKIVACAFVPVSTHSPFAPPNNLESDDAIDIAVPAGTPVLAVAGGTIGEQIGSLNSSDPRMQGLRVHLDTPGRRYYYAHLSRIDVIPGQQVTAGQQLGLSGVAAGLPHLHFAQDGGNPAVTVGEPLTCPFFTQYNESW
jgi:murein DD-endopeptidase MepM/ murein hydrolase activator NlpD